MAGEKKAEPVKEFVCHITEIDCANDMAYGHVIWVSENAVYAHCDHGDHYPSGVIGNAQEACVEFKGEEFDKCERKYAIGADCSRTLSKPWAVKELCGAKFVPFELCAEE